MPILDELNTTLANMYAKGGVLPLTTLRENPVFSYLLKNSAMFLAGGTPFERPVGVGSAFRGQRTATGFEVAEFTQRNIVSKFSVAPWAGFAPMAIPLTALDSNRGPNGVVRLIDSYPKTFYATVNQEFGRWFLSGAVSSDTNPVFSSGDLDGLATLNGEVTVSSPSRGWLKQAAPASQTGTVQNVTVSQASGIYNQYGAVTSFASDGMDTIDTVRVACANRAGGSKLMGVADEVSFMRVNRANASNVLVRSTDEDIYGEKMVIPLAGALLHSDPGLDPTASSFSGTTGYSTSSTTGGLIYFLPVDDLEMPCLLKFEGEAAPKFVQMSHNQTVVSAQHRWHFNFTMTRLAAFGVVAGTRIP